MNDEPNWKEKYIEERRENTKLRGILANSSLACVHCGLAADKTVECKGYPMDCERMNDALEAL
jgi:hypothetical protein